MSLHVILLSGMDAKDTTNYLISNGFSNDIVLENQIQRYVKTIGTNEPVRVTLWVALNTILTQKLLIGIKYRIKNILFVYHSNKPITMVRAHGWWKYLIETFDCSGYNMILCATIESTPSPNVGYDRLISHIANKFLTNADVQMPHYAATLSKIFKQF
jgi:hypothetical protein